MLPASFAACVPEFIARPTSAWASAGASLVPSPTIATSRPPACSARMRASLSSGRGLGDVVVDAGFGGDRGGGERVVAGDHHRAHAHRAQPGEALLDAVLDHVRQLDHAEHVLAFGDHQRRGAAAGDLVDARGCSSGDDLAAERLHVLADRVARALADHAAAPSSCRSTPDMRVCAVNCT